MSNVWTSVASSLPRRQTRASPLLQLFNGYAKSQSIRSFAQWSFACHGYRQAPGSNVASHSNKAAFSTTPCVAKKGIAKASGRTPPSTQAKANKTKGADNSAAARLQPAPTVASHTEGLPPQSEGNQLTWRDYDPEGGMPLPGGDLLEPQINAIFGDKDMDVDTGNYILNVMHWRRQSGALIDVGLKFSGEIKVTREQALKALEYVRSQLPDVDEVGNGAEWAKEEEERLRQELQARAVKLRLLKPSEEDATEEDYQDIEESQQGTEAGRQKTGYSVLQATRKANETEYEIFKREQEEARKQAELNAVAAQRGPLELLGGVQPGLFGTGNAFQAARKGPFGITIRPPSPQAFLERPRQQAFLERPREKPAYIKYYEEKAMIIKENVVPQMSTIARLGPSFLVLLLVLAGCWYLHQNYTPPPTPARLWPDTPPAVATLWGVTGLLVATFFLGRLPPLWRTYNKYMASSPSYPYALSLIGACFRHDQFWHLASNVITLWLFGLFLHEEVGRGTFLAIYLASGVTGIFTSLVYHVLRKQWMVYVIGASSSVMGVTAAICTLKPTGSIEVFGYKIPVYAWMYLALIGVTETAAAFRALKTTMDHAGHVGGMISGGAAAFALRYHAAQNRLAGEQNVVQMVQKDAKEVAGELKREAKEADLI
ncbi:hypothetical protein BST61_g4463 [Cercospora zeina]